MNICRGRSTKDFFLASLLYDKIEDLNLSSIEELLVKKSADPNLVLPKYGIAPFHLVIGNECRDFALKATKLMLQHGGDPNVRSDDGVTPVHVAAAWGCTEILEILLNCGGDPELRDEDNNSPIDYARRENYENCVQLLEKFFSDKAQILNRNEDNCSKYDLSLDKILVNSVDPIGRNEIVNEYKIIDSRNYTVHKDLPALPSPIKSNDYTANWVENHASNSKNPPESPVESLCESDYNSESANVLNKKFYIKHRSPQKANSPKQIPIIVIKNCNDSTIIDTSWNKPYLELSSGLDVLNWSKISKMNEDKSSDYITCSSSARSSEAPKNICEEKETETGRRVSLDSKSEGICSNETINVSVSEVYKYVDQDQGITLYEKRLLRSPNSEGNGTIRTIASSSSSISSAATTNYDTDTLRRELTLKGYNPGPITLTTKSVYLKKLKELKENPKSPTQPTKTPETQKVYSVELQSTIKNPDWFRNVSAYKTLEDKICKDFACIGVPPKKWREGSNKSSFTYMLLDPRITKNLPHRADSLSVQEKWQCFLSSIFYIGKGKRSRPHSHLYDAMTLWNAGTRCVSTENKKLQRILDVWNENCGVVCLQIFQNVIPVEAYTREAAMISALTINNLCNIKPGNFYGMAFTWPHKEQRKLGVYLLYKAMMIFLQEGERQLYPSDIN